MTKSFTAAAVLLLEEEGWNVAAYNGEPEGGHGGSLMTGFTSAMVHLPRRELSVIVLTNQHAANAARIAYTVAGLYDPELRTGKSTPRIG